jgi:hypothetical protein
VTVGIPAAAVGEVAREVDLELVREDLFIASSTKYNLLLVPHP